LTIARSDGTIVRSLTRPINPGWIEWSPDGTRLAVIDSSPNTFSIVHLDGSETQNFDLGLEAEQVFWRPDGNELIIRTVSTGPDVETYGLFVVRADGTDPREIDISIPSQIQEPALSPDGTQVMFAIWEGDPIDGGHLYVVNVETGNLRRLVFDGPFESEYFGEWSPDGSRIVFTQGTAQETYQLAVGPAGGGHVVSLGPELPWDAGAQTAFSPDGSKVIARYNNGETWIFDASGGPGEQLDITTTELLNWQRVAP
jgi:Tol biopolymer transport system component